MAVQTLMGVFDGGAGGAMAPPNCRARNSVGPKIQRGGEKKRRKKEKEKKKERKKKKGEGKKRRREEQEQEQEQENIKSVSASQHSIFLLRVTHYRAPI